MDAYDRIQEEALSPDTPNAPESSEAQQQTGQSNDLGTEFREAYQALSTSAWGLKLGGFFEQVKKQGTSYYEGAKQELSAASAEASKGWTDLISHTSTVPSDQPDASQDLQAQGSTDAATESVSRDANPPPAAQVPESLPADIVKEAETMLSRFRVDAAARLKQIQEAEDAADAALERFGTNIKNFLRDAVTVAPPSIDDDPNVKKDVLFESKDLDGKRVLHATRFDAQLHVIHSNLSSFSQDPSSPQYGDWKTSFDVESKTDAIAKDLEKYDELRRAMDSLVPEQVSYADFWTRYYFLRYVLETEEQKRRELLQGTQLDEEEVAWDDDDDDDDDDRAGMSQNTSKISQGQEGHASTATLTVQNSSTNHSSPADHLKPTEPRRSNEQSVADSDASYDIVSGTTSRGPGTPREEKDLSDKKAPPKASDDSDEDWE